MQANLEKMKNLYQPFEIKITAFDSDVITASDDPYVDDEYGNLFD